MESRYESAPWPGRRSRGPYWQYVNLVRARVNCEMQNYPVVLTATSNFWPANKLVNHLGRELIKLKSVIAFQC